MRAIEQTTTSMLPSRRGAATRRRAQAGQPAAASAGEFDGGDVHAYVPLTAGQPLGLRAVAACQVEDGGGGRDSVAEPVIGRRPGAVDGVFEHTLGDTRVLAVEVAEVVLPVSVPHGERWSGQRVEGCA
ncbi:MAG: hypothetical protein M3291_00785 [Actinomycetota bacterium]|nr:hypothetical protein [Actinomycetota bacterium]